MTTNNREMFTIDSYNLDVEELEERLELAALFATNTDGTNGDQTIASAYTDPSCWSQWHDGCSL